MNSIDDPEINFTLSQNDALGMPIPEHVFYQLIGFSFGQIVKSIPTSDNIVDQLFARLSTDVRKSIKNWLTHHPNIGVTLNWPREDVGLPFIAVITESEDETEDLSLLGDYGGTHVLGSLDVGPQQARQLFKTGLSNVTNVIIAADDPNMTLYMGAILRFIFLRNKDALTKMYDIHNLMVSQADLKWDERFLPTFAYMRMLSLRYKTFFDINVTEKTSVITSLELMVSALSAGAIVTSSVPDTHTGSASVIDVEPEPEPDPPESFMAVDAGQSNAIAFMDPTLVTVYSGLSSTDPRVKQIDKNAPAFNNPPAFTNEPATVGTTRDLGPRLLPIGGSYVANRGGSELSRMRELANRTVHTWFQGKLGIDGSSLITGWNQPSYPTGGPSLRDQTISNIQSWATIFGITNIADHLVLYWKQGEADTGQAYATILAALDAFFAYLRATLGNFYIVMLRLSNRNDKAGNYRAAQESFYSTTDRVAIVCADELALRDAAHYTDNSYATIGVKESDVTIPLINGTAPVLPMYVATGPFTISGSGATSTPVLPRHKAGDIIILWGSALGQNAYSLTVANGFVEGTASPQHDAGNSLNARGMYWWVRADQTTMDANGGQMPAPTVGDPVGDDFKIFAASIFRGCVATGNPIDAAQGSTAASSTSITFPTLNTNSDDCVIINFIAYRVDDPLQNPQVDGWTNGSLDGGVIVEHIDKDTNSGQGYGIGMACGYKADAGPVSATAATLGIAGTMVLFSIALKRA